MKFRFPFENVLKHRKSLEDVAQRDFQAALAELNRQRNLLEEMHAAKTAAHQEAFKTQNAGGAAGPALSQIHEFLTGHDLRIESQVTKIQEMEKQVESLRDILRQRAIDYKIIEKLKEKKKQLFNEERKRKEQKQIDEINLMRFGRHGR